MPSMNWLFGSLSKQELNSLIDIIEIGGVPSTPPSGTASINGALSVSDGIDGVLNGVVECTTLGSVQDKVLPITVGGSQDVRLVYFDNENTYQGVIYIVANNIRYTLYINGDVSSVNNYTISKGVHFLSFTTTTNNDREVYLDFLLPNSPASYPTTLSWEEDIDSLTNVQVGLKLKMRGYNMPDVLSPSIPVASSSTFGIVSIGSQTFAGAKTFSDVTSIIDTTDADGLGNAAFKVSGGIDCAKTLRCQSVVITSSRDAKTNINPFVKNATDILNSVNIVSFNYKNDVNHLKVGFIAEDTNPLLSSETQKKFDIGNSIGLLIKSVQELSERIKELENANSN